MSAHGSREPGHAEGGKSECERPVCSDCGARCSDDDMVAGTETDAEPLFICDSCCDWYYREYIEASQRAYLKELLR